MQRDAFSLTVKQKRSLQILFIFVPFLMGSGIDLYVPSLPAIASYFHTSTQLVQLTIALYMLGNGIGQVILGVLSDSLGRRGMLIFGALLYVSISFLSIWAANIYLLIICRFFQGFGVAGLSSITRAILTDSFTGVEMAKVMAVMGASWSLGPVIGPAIGGYLQHYFGWQANFWFFALCGLLLAIYILPIVPETIQQRSPLQLKTLGNIVKRLIFSKMFMLSSIVMGFILSVSIVFNAIGPFIFQQVLGYSAVQYGHIALLIGVTYLVGTFANRILLSMLQPPRLILIGLVLSIIVSLAMVAISLIMPMSIYTILLPVMLLSFFGAIIMPNLFVQSVGLFSDIGGSANAIFGALTSLGVFIAGVVASNFHVTTQLPMAAIFVVLTTISLFIMLFLQLS